MLKAGAFALHHARRRTNVVYSKRPCLSKISMFSSLTEKQKARPLH
jgi:hypothetical protein